MALEYTEPRISFFEKNILCDTARDNEEINVQGFKFLYVDRTSTATNVGIRFNNADATSIPLQVADVIRLKDGCFKFFLTHTAQPGTFIKLILSVEDVITPSSGSIAAITTLINLNNITNPVKVINAPGTTIETETTIVNDPESAPISVYTPDLEDHYVYVRSHPNHPISFFSSIASPNYVEVINNSINVKSVPGEYVEIDPTASSVFKVINDTGTQLTVEGTSTNSDVGVRGTTGSSSDSLKVRGVASEPIYVQSPSGVYLRTVDIGRRIKSENIGSVSLSVSNNTSYNVVSVPAGSYFIPISVYQATNRTSSHPICTTGFQWDSTYTILDNFTFDTSYGTGVICTAIGTGSVLSFDPRIANFFNSAWQNTNGSARYVTFATGNGGWGSETINIVYAVVTE